VWFLADHFACTSLGEFGMLCMDNEAISKSLESDAILEKEWQDLRDELPTLTHREMIRKVQIKERMEAIGKERFELFKERRQIYNQDSI
jgi:hypothetical protein